MSATTAEKGLLGDKLATLPKSGPERREALGRLEGQLAAALAFVQEELRNVMQPPTEKETGSAPEVRVLNERQKQYLFGQLELRMSANPSHYDRPEAVTFETVRKSLEADPAAMFTLYLSERTGGEPDVRFVRDGKLMFVCSSEDAPSGGSALMDDERQLSTDLQRLIIRGRRNCVYDDAAQKQLEAQGLICSTREQSGDFNGNAIDDARIMGYDGILSDADYKRIQRTGRKTGHDQRTWIWEDTPAEERANGGARCGSRVGVHVDSYLDGAGFHSRHGSWRGLRGVTIVP